MKKQKKMTHIMVSSVKELMTAKTQAKIEQYGVQEV